MGNKVSTKTMFHLDKTVLGEDELRYLLQHTKMSREQIVDFHDDFLRDCPNGYLTKKEFIKMFKEMYQCDCANKKGDKFCEYVFKAIDENSNSLIEFTDFIICFSISSFGTLKEKIRLAFKIYDVNQDGLIDRVEFSKVIESLVDFTNDRQIDRKDNRSLKQTVDFLMKKLDKNRNHVIEFDEFMNGCLEDDYVRSILVDKMFNN